MNGKKIRFGSSHNCSEGLRAPVEFRGFVAKDRNTKIERQREHGEGRGKRRERKEERKEIAFITSSLLLSIKVLT